MCFKPRNREYILEFVNSYYAGIRFFTGFSAVFLSGQNIFHNLRTLVVGASQRCGKPHDAVSCKRMKKTFCGIIILLFYITTLYAEKEFDYEALSRYSIHELFQHANQYLAHNENDTAIAYFLSIIGGYESDKNPNIQRICVHSYIAVGKIYYKQGYYSKAFDSFTNAIKISEENNFSDLLPQIYNNLGSIYCAWQDYAQGLFYYQKALEQADPRQQEDLYKKLLINIIGVYCERKNVPMAESYYNRLYQFHGQDSLTNYFCLLNKGLILIADNKEKEAIKYIHQTCKYAEDVRLSSGYLSSAYTTLAQLYERTDPDSSMFYYQKALRDDLPPYMQRGLLKQLSFLYQEKDRQKALLYTQRYLLLSDSLFNESEINRMKGSQFIYESEKNFRKIKSLNEEKQVQQQQIKAQRTTIVITALILILFIGMFILLIIQKKKLSRAYKDLFFRSNTILKAEQENQQIREGLEETIRNLKAELAESAKHTDTTPAQPTENEDTLSDQNSNKQQSANKLTDEQKQHILSAVNQVIKHTDAIYDCDFSIETLADLTGYNSKYISKVINDTYQCNFRTFLNEYRIKESQKRLLNTKEYGNYTINAIAQSVGYKSHANFIILFRKHVGISPSAYQKMAKEYGTGNIPLHLLNN